MTGVTVITGATVFVVVAIATGGAGAGVLADDVELYRTAAKSEEPT